MLRRSLVLRASKDLKLDKFVQKRTLNSNDDWQKRVPQYVKDYQGKTQECYQRLLKKLAPQIAVYRYEEYLDKFNCFIVFEDRTHDVCDELSTVADCCGATVQRHELELSSFSERFDKDVVQDISKASLIQWLHVDSPQLVTDSICRTQECGYQPLLLAVKMSYGSDKDVLKNLKPFLSEFRLRYDEAFTYDNLLNIAKMRTDYDTEDISFLVRTLGELGLVNPLILHTKSSPKTGWLVFGK